MRISRETMSGILVTIIIPFEVEKRLRGTCYRGENLPLAGNFMKFTSSDDLLKDKDVIEAFLAKIEELWKENLRGTFRLSIMCPDLVGWESTVPRNGFALDDLALVEPNKRSVAFFVKESRKDILAPRTNELTIVAELKRGRKFPLVIVRSVYPGKDIGSLSGNITKREGRVFFSWGHPGE